MKVPNVIASAAVGAVVALQAWTLSEIVKLKVQVAEIKTAMQLASSPEISQAKIAQSKHSSP